MLKKIVMVLMLVGLVFGSDDRNEFETQYVAGCVSGYKSGGNIPLATFAAICVCAWQGIETRYSYKELKSLHSEKIEAVNSTLAGDFMKFNATRVTQCLNLQKIKK